MKLAHLIMAHTAPKQLLRLVERLKHPDVDIYIYLDAKVNPVDFSILNNIENVKFLTKRIPVAWCGYSTVKATLLALQEIIDTGNIYSHINFLSGQDYPLKSAEETQRFFSTNPGKSYMLTLSVETEWEHGLARTKKFYLGDYKFPARHKFQTAINYLNIKRRVPGNLSVFGGSQWFSITPEAAKYVIDYMNSHKKLERYFKLTFASDEIVFQTVLKASPLKNTLVNDHLRYIEMSPVTFRPETFTAKDEQALINSGKFYARKFDLEKSAEVLDKLDELALCHS